MTVPIGWVARAVTLATLVAFPAGLSAFERSEQAPSKPETAIVPYAGNVATFTAMGLQGVSVHANYREFLSTHSMRCDKGADQPTPISYRLGCVTDYSDMLAMPGSIEAWGGNTNVVVAPGWVKAGGYAAYGQEINVNYGANSAPGADGVAFVYGPSDVDIGNNDGPPIGYSGHRPFSPSITALALTSIGKKVTGAIAIGTDGQREFNRGLFFQAGSISQCAICDYSSGANSVLDIRGPHQVGVDLKGFSGGVPIRVNNGGSIVGQNRTGSRDIGIAAINSSDQLQIGQGSAASLFFSPVTPSQDLGMPLGTAEARWSSVNAAAYSEILKTPLNSHEPCTPGEFGDDANYHYVCVSKNRWKRVALTDF